VVWASGVGGTYVVTTDGGRNLAGGRGWGRNNFQFRDVQGGERNNRLSLSPRRRSGFRIYRAEDGGASLVAAIPELGPDAFYDCFAFWIRAPAVSP